MKVLQINAVYEKFSTGRTTKELHEAMISNGIESYIACPDLSSLTVNCYRIGNKFDYKIHSLCSRIFGKQAHYSKIATEKLISYISEVEPDVIHLRNLHSNYINLPMLLKYIADKNIATVLTLHDSWFYTGKCVYYIEFGCDRWKEHCGNCPALRAGNPSLFFDRSQSLLKEKEQLFSKIKKLAVIGVSQWVTDDASVSILKNAKIIKCIYNWIDLDRFKPHDTQQYKNSLGLENKFIILGIAMSWNEQKGINVFQKLAELLPNDCKIVLVGDYSTVKEKNPKIDFLGTVKDVNVLSQLYAMADVFVNPTIQETFGKTTAEALACGTPVVAYDGTATPELVGRDESCGYLVNQNKAECYYEKILKVKENTKEYYSDFARNRAVNLFSKEKNIEEYIDVYKSLIND